MNLRELEDSLTDDMTRCELIDYYHTRIALLIKRIAELEVEREDRCQQIRALLGRIDQLERKVSLLIRSGESYPHLPEVKQ
jgi:hypothetical protein